MIVTQSRGMFAGHNLFPLLGPVYPQIFRYRECKVSLFSLNSVAWSLKALYYFGLSFQFTVFKLSRSQASLILFSLHKLDKISHVFPDDDIDSNNLPDDELEVYFNKLMPPAMQRGRVEGQELPATVRRSVRLGCLIEFPCSVPAVSLHQKHCLLK